MPGDIAPAATSWSRISAPGVMAQFGLDYDDPRRGPAGPGLLLDHRLRHRGGADLPGYDLLVQARRRADEHYRLPRAEPSKVGVALVDVLTGQNALAGILTALRVRDPTGTGQQVEVNLLSSLLAAWSTRPPPRWPPAHPRSAWATPTRASRLTRPCAPRTAPLAVAVGNDRQFAALAGVLGRSRPGGGQQVPQQRKPRGPPGRAEAPLLEERWPTKPAEQWHGNRWRRRAFPPARSTPSWRLSHWPTSLGLEPVVEISDPVQPPGSRQVANPIQLSETPAAYRRLPPLARRHGGATFAASEDRPPSKLPPPESITMI